MAPPDALKVSLLAAYERRSGARPAPSWRARAWTRMAVPLAAGLSAAAVLLAGTILRSPGAGTAEWVQVHPTSLAANPRVRVVDVEDPSLAALGSVGTMLAAAPMEGP